MSRVIQFGFWTLTFFLLLSASTAEEHHYSTTINEGDTINCDGYRIVDIKYARVSADSITDTDVTEKIRSMCFHKSACTIDFSNNLYVEYYCKTNHLMKVTTVRRDECVLDTDYGGKKYSYSSEICYILSKSTGNPMLTLTPDTLHQDVLTYLRLDNRKTKWYNGKEFTNGFIEVYGVIDDISIHHNDKCYISITDKGSNVRLSPKIERNFLFFFQYVANPLMCRHALELLLKKIPAIVKMRIDPNPNNSNDVLSIVAQNKYSAEKNYKSIKLKRESSEKRRKRGLERDAINMDALLAFYHTMLPSIQTKIVPQNNYEYGVILVSLPNSQEVNLTMYARGTLYPNRQRDQTALTSQVRKRMDLMGFLRNDEQGHLISRALGGFQDYNIVPMATNVNRHRVVGDPNAVDSNPCSNPNQLATKQNLKSIAYPLSGWRSNEKFLENFLNEGGNRRVEYSVAVQYDRELMSTLQQRGPPIVHDTNLLRATHFMQYFEMYENNLLKDRYGPFTFVNDDSFQCTDVEPDEDD